MQDPPGTSARRGPGSRAPKLPADARQRQLLDVAIHVFAQHGYTGASTQAIAAAAGLSEPALYRHFPSKRALFLAAFDRASTELLDTWRSIAAESASPLEAIARIGVWYTDRLRARPDDLVLRYRSLNHTDDAELGARVRSNYRATLAFVRDLYEQARARGLLEPSADARALAWLFLAVGAALDQAQLLQLGDELPPEVMGRIAALLLSGGGARTR
ncbi:MAG: TetR/AcrR family transcriptional regulator [Myxococcota bacterium]